ncbi:hypothetical protein N0V82_003497 [Gnomoniopsis sp. IMI 355080]|nr:hypothetical protein N0V82_003497 [Gnomoniopsis sp. IMI 355080]
MTKSKSKRKQAGSQAVNGTVAKKVKADCPAAITLTGSPYEPKLLQTVVSEEELEITVDTLRTLADNPSLIKSKACKDLRAAVFDFKQASTTGSIASVDANLTSRISGALADQNWVDARVMLAEMKVRGQKPKLGALCRWVRDLDVISGLAEQRDGTGVKRSDLQLDVLNVLDAVLRVVGPIDYSAGDAAESGPMVVRKAWDLRDGRERRMVYESVLNGSLIKTVDDETTSRFRILDTTPGLQRKPPNHHPAILHASQDNTIKFSSPAPTTTHHQHPTVPNLHLMKDVLTANECEQIIGAAEKIGFTPDAPIRAAGEEVSILAHNFYWIADEAFCAGLWSRVEPFVPAAVGGRRVRGLNRRFRVYRYVPGAEYRAHIDGAWPPSGISAEDKYLYDASPPGAKQSSLFTFLIYLNDEFEAGETTYFLPGPREGTLNAYPLKPIQGSVALFPHGEVDGNLLHEGTGVQKGDRPSAKYVIRTDVEYDVEAQTA